MDVLLALAPFCKNSIEATLKGVTNSPDVPSVDHIKCSAFNILKKFMSCDDNTLDIKIIKRGLKPLGGGEIIFKCPVKKNLKAIQMSNSGMVKRIRGVVYSCKVSPTFANRTGNIKVETKNLNQQINHEIYYFSRIFQRSYAEIPTRHLHPYRSKQR